MMRTNQGCAAWKRWLGLGIAVLGLQASAADIRVLTAGAFKPILLAVQPAFEAQTGHRLVIDNDTAGALQRRVLGGEAFDLIVSSPASLKAMRQGGKLSDVAPIELAQVSIGVAVMPDVPSPDIATVDQFRQALKNARRVAYIDPAAGGSSGIYLDGLFNRWGIRDEIRAKAVLVPGGLVAKHLLDGSADLAIHQISEIKAVPGVKLVGPLPAEIQNRTVYAAAVPTASLSEPVSALLQFMGSDRWLPLWQEKGMEPLFKQPGR
jgi:molybdate transport system substrate-binding protein